MTQAVLLSEGCCDESQLGNVCDIYGRNGRQFHFWHHLMSYQLTKAQLHVKKTNFCFIEWQQQRCRISVQVGGATSPLMVESRLMLVSRLMAVQLGAF